MAKRSSGSGEAAGRRASTATTDGNVLVLRQELSRGTIRKLGEGPGSAAASIEDAWARREEALFERLAVSWEIAGLPLDDQKMLLARYRMAGAEERRWVRATIAAPPRGASFPSWPER